jgi:hypothetical protein
MRLRNKYILICKIKEICAVYLNFRNLDSFSIKKNIMKKSFFIFYFLLSASSILAQNKISDFTGIWKITEKGSETRVKNEKQYLYLMDDSIYAWGVDIKENPLPGVITGRWIIMKDGRIEFTSTGMGPGTRYFQPVKKDEYKFIDSVDRKQNKKPHIIYIKKVKVNLLN